ncbi:hypothetical protein F5Y04DRAFT_288696 [Hypomontagnella monticulosa]|nr:hypothetical protein F5Y04DRAFT_288696 [Hypomontagnella monticulosa]
MAGIIGTHFHDNNSFQLPPTSYYAPIEKTIAGWASGELKPGVVPAEQFAETLVEDIVGEGRQGMVWKGPHAGSIKSLSQWAPRSVVDTAMSHNQGLDELKKRNAGKAGE